MAAPKTEIPESILKEMFRLSTEESWSDARIAEMAKERWGLNVSRATVQRRMAEMRGGGKAAPGVPDPGEIEEPPLPDEAQLERLQRDLFRSARAAHRDGQVNVQVRAALALTQLIEAKVRMREKNVPPAGEQQQQPLTQEQIDAAVAAELN